MGLNCFQDYFIFVICLRHWKRSTVSCLSSSHPGTSCVWKLFDWYSNYASSRRTSLLITLFSIYRLLSLLGLLIIAIGTGGIKSSVSSFGGDQFVLPEQALQLQQFFSVFYFSINAGSMVSTVLTPILRNDVQCFGQETCFPLAFGVPAVLMITSICRLFIPIPISWKKDERYTIYLLHGC